MADPFSFSTTYILDKSHFSETFDESCSIDTSLSAYTKSMVMVSVGCVILLFTPFSQYVGWFIVALAILEALSVRYKKPWWLSRQMLSKAANSELTLTIDDKGICSKSYYVDSSIAWTDVIKIEATRLGWLLHLASGKTYLSGRCLSDDAKHFINAKVVG